MLYRFPDSAIVRCKACGLVFAQDSLTRMDLERHYQSEYYKGAMDSACYGCQFTSQFAKRLFPLRKFYLDKLGTYFPKKGRLLDIGCGMGLFLAFAQENGWDVLGIEPFEGFAKYSVNHLGVKIIVGSFEDLRIKEKFDVITLFHTLEHMFDPRMVLEKIYSLLNPGGVVLIEVPNMGSPFSRWKGKSWFAPKNHRFYFTREALGRYLKEVGLEILEESARQNERNSLLATLVLSAFGILGLREFFDPLLRKEVQALCGQKSEVGLVKPLSSGIYRVVLFLDFFLRPVELCVNRINLGENLFFVAKKPPTGL